MEESGIAQMINNLKNCIKTNLVPLYNEEDSVNYSDLCDVTTSGPYIQLF